ncbi:hypothetical protein K0504_04180 [Neiella marina]|uniref:Peptidase M3A/M3B catalytic domain-containing protein n=1 Tax=Neiella holothuriorum TaxID=2870530 RepID=A0ABS7EEJ4_9GAMM|nr:M3 family metallopeptidase [Neiella holothuriorum]MBW8190226.1 hypothetical protein [Neiella holothuriorum]
MQSPTQWPQSAGELAMQCEQAAGRIDQILSRDVEADEQLLRLLDEAVAGLESQIAISMVLADASPNADLRQQALLCLDALSTIEQQWLSFDETSDMLSALEDQTLSKQGSRLLGLWLHQAGLVSGERAQQSNQRLHYAEAGYQQTLRALDKKLRLPQQCQQGVPTDQLQRWLSNDQFELPLRGAQVIRFLRYPVATECRRMAWVALQSKGMPENMMQLDMVLNQRQLWAKNHGAANFADYQLRTQLLDSPELVMQYLAATAAANLPQQFEHSDWLYTSVRAPDSAADVGQSPIAVMQQTFQYLQQFGLQFTPVVAPDLLTPKQLEQQQHNQPARYWHPGVAAYHLSVTANGDDQPRVLATVYFDVFARSNKSASARHRALRHGVYGGGEAESAVLMALPITAWYGRDRRSFYRQLGQAVQHAMARAEYHGLSGSPIERDFSRLGMALFEALMADHDPWLAGQIKSPKRIAKKLFRASVSLDYHRLGMSNFAGLQSINQHYFERYMKVPMPPEYTPQYSLNTLISDGVLYYQRLWYPAFAKLLLSCTEQVNGTFMQQLFEPAGQSAAFNAVQQVCPNIHSLEQLVNQVATVKRLQ